jgi:flavorubredoxin
MISEILFDDGHRSWRFFGRDPQLPDEFIDTNQYLVVHDGAGLLCDPGGIEVFPSVVAEVSRVFDPAKLEALFGSHQDPDIISSLSLWVALKPDVKVYVPWLWTGFLKHFASDAQMIPIADEGGILPLGGSHELTFVPAHYLHSSGNHGLYDPRAKILFSGDVGAALLSKDDAPMTVTDFDRHIRAMEGFHRRWMPSNRAKQAWIDRVRCLDVDLLCPQHGAIFQGPMVDRFLQWLEDLEVGTAA